MCIPKPAATIIQENQQKDHCPSRFLTGHPVNNVSALVSASCYLSQQQSMSLFRSLLRRSLVPVRIRLPSAPPRPLQKVIFSPRLMKSKVLDCLYLGYPKSGHPNLGYPNLSCMKHISCTLISTAANTVMAKLLSWSEKATRVLGTQECERRDPVRYSPVEEGVSDLSTIGDKIKSHRGIS